MQLCGSHVASQIAAMGGLHEQHRGEVKNGRLCRQGIRFQEEAKTSSIVDAVKIILQGLREDVHREGVRNTPVRVARAFQEATRGYKQKVKEIIRDAVFEEAGLDDDIGQAGGTGGLVIVRDINLFSCCESCLLPFQVKCHVGYVPSCQKVVGLSKLSRIVDVFGKRLQNPHRLADQVCSALHQSIKPSGVAVLLQSSHIFFPHPEPFFLDSSDHQFWINLAVRSGLGVFQDYDSSRWADFMSLLNLNSSNITMAKAQLREECCWCPFRSSWLTEVPPAKHSPDHLSMLAAVSSILTALGEDLSRRELIGTPNCFLKWMINFVNLNNAHAQVVKLNGNNGNSPVRHHGEKLHSELNLSFWSLCEHHLLPFYGVVHVGYFLVNGYNPVARSVLLSTIQFYGSRLQVQERLTRQIGEAISSMLGRDVVVVVEASHTCMISRGIEKFGSSTTTVAELGRFSTDPGARSVFLQSIPNPIRSPEVNLKTHIHR